MEHYCRKGNSPPRPISKAAMDILLGYGWPGNVRELENVIERAILLKRSGKLEPSDLPERVSKQVESSIVAEVQPANPTLESIEKAYIHYIMSQTDGKKTEAARILGIDTSTLYRKIQRYDIDTPGKSASKKKSDA